jgi:hypothetical protein
VPNQAGNGKPARDPLQRRARRISRATAASLRMRAERNETKAL